MALAAWICEGNAGQGGDKGDLPRMLSASDESHPAHAHRRSVRARLRRGADAAPASRRGAGQGRHHRREPAGAAGAPRHLSMDAAAAGDPRHRDGRHGGRARRRARPAFAVGDKVYVSARELPVRAGCYAEYIAVPERALFRLPPETDLEAAACLSNYQVAYHLLHTATRGAPGKTVLVDGASGGLGSAAVQLAKLAGMTAIGLVGSDGEGARAAGVRRRPCHRPQPRRMSPARVAAITGGEGVDLILDAVGGGRFARNLAMLAPFGLAVSYGRLQGPLGGQRDGGARTAGRAISTAPRSASSPCTRSTTSRRSARNR